MPQLSPSSVLEILVETRPLNPNEDCPKGLIYKTTAGTSHRVHVLLKEYFILFDLPLPEGYQLKHACRETPTSGDMIIGFSE